LQWIFKNVKNPDGSAMNLDGLILDNDGIITYDLTDLIGGPAPSKPKVPGHRHSLCSY
jgi:hypothetical protein